LSKRWLDVKEEEEDEEEEEEVRLCRYTDS
jgi:hypothetical protein